MNVLKRIEVWVLLLLVVGVLLFVLRQAGSDDPMAADPSATGGDSEAGLQVLSTTLARDYGNAKLTLALKLRNGGEKPIVAAPPALRLLTGGGAEVPPFFLPFQDRIEIPPGESAEVSQTFWLESDDLSGELWLQAGEERAPVKDASPFDLDGMENQGERAFRSPNWN